MSSNVQALERFPPLRVAVAANFLMPMEEIRRVFTGETGIELQIIAGSTGKLYAQIKHSAPFDLFLAADTKRPRLLFEQGLVDKPINYAKGMVYLWSTEKIDAVNWQEALKQIRTAKVAIPSPDTAPYGEAARKALHNARQWVQIENNLVYGQSVAQAFQFGVSGGVKAAFVSASYALSEQGRKGSSWLVSEAGKVNQAACLILKSNYPERATRFLSFTTSMKVQPILQRYGYQ